MESGIEGVESGIEGVESGIEGVGSGIEGVESWHITLRARRTKNQGFGVI